MEGPVQCTRVSSRHVRLQGLSFQNTAVPPIITMKVMVPKAAYYYAGGFFIGNKCQVLSVEG